jgi:hypothetical protein
MKYYISCEHDDGTKSCGIVSDKPITWDEFYKILDLSQANWLTRLNARIKFFLFRRRNK